MGSMQLSDSRLLYKEVLHRREPNKLKKVYVTLKQQCSSEDRKTKVYQLDMCGVKHRSHVDFHEHQLCFMGTEESSWAQPQSMCFPCNRNSRDNLGSMLTCLVIIFHLDKAEGGRPCFMTIRLYQPGNTYSATSLHKLRDVMRRNVSGADDVQHWVVIVVECGHVMQNTRVFVAVTRHALMVVYQQQVIQYHPFSTCHLTVDSEIAQHRLCVNVNTLHGANNFALFSRYIFHTSQCETIGKCIKGFQRQSQVLFPTPKPHLNIPHSELVSASDNCMVLPHAHQPTESNHTGSSSTNGFTPQSTSKDFNVSIHPVPHCIPSTVRNDSSSFPGSSGMEQKPLNIPTVNSQQQDEGLSLTPRGSEGHTEVKISVNKMQTLPSGGKMQAVSSVEKMQASKFEQFENFDASKLSASSSPTRLLSSNDQHSSPCLITNVHDIFPLPVEDWEDLPPPPPCSSTTPVHAEMFFSKDVPDLAPRASTKNSHTEPKQTPGMRRSSILRTQSFSDALDNDSYTHTYVNVEQSLVLRKNVHDDSPYYRFYYNYGFVRMVRMSQKLKRRNRLSKELPKLDLNKMGNHEQWFDRCFKTRERDSKFCKLKQMNIPVDPIYSTVPRAPRDFITPDDPYWNSELCVTLQYILQDGSGTSGIFQEIRDCLDISSEQLIVIQTLLSLYPADKDWKDLAELIGLTYSDMTVIEHFCYTYRELTMKVILAHWLRMSRRGWGNQACTLEALCIFLERCDRTDVVRVLQKSPENQEELITHF